MERTSIARIKESINEVLLLGKTKERKSLTEMGLKLSEETGEVSEAILSMTNACGCGYKGKTKEDVIEECCDVIIMATSIIGRLDGDIYDMEKMISNKIIKWKNKINEDNIPVLTTKECLIDKLVEQVGLSRKDIENILDAYQKEALNMAENKLNNVLKEIR